MDSRRKVPPPVYNVHYEGSHFRVRGAPQNQRTNQHGRHQSLPNVSPVTSHAQHVPSSVHAVPLQQQARRQRTGQQRVGQQREVQPIEIAPIPQTAMPQRTSHQRSRTGPLQQSTVPQQRTIVQQRIVPPQRNLQQQQPRTVQQQRNLQQQRNVQQQHNVQQQRSVPSRVMPQQRVVQHQRTVSQPQLQRSIPQQQQRVVTPSRNVHQQQQQQQQQRQQQQRQQQQRQQPQQPMGHIVQAAHQQRPQNTAPNQIPVSTHGYTYRNTPTSNLAGPPSKQSRNIVPQAPLSDSLPLDLSKNSPMPNTSSVNKSLPISKSVSISKNLPMPLDLSSKSSTPIRKEKELPAPMTITLVQCPFCNMTCTNSNQMKNHLERCPKLTAASSLALNRDRWMENNVPPPMPSTSTTQMRVDDIASIRDNLPRINGANIIGEFIIQDDPLYIKQEVDSEDDAEMFESKISAKKSLDKSCYKSSTRKASPSIDLPAPEVIKKSLPIVTAFDVSVSAQKEVSIEPVTVQKASRPVLLSRSILKDRQKSPEETRPSAKSAPTVKHVEPPVVTKETSLKKTPDEQSADSRHSSTPSKTNEKRPTKRQPELSILNIADNLLRRMTQKSQNSQKAVIPEPVPSVEEVKQTEVVKEPETPKDEAPKEEAKVDEVQPESSEDEVSFKVAQPEKEPVKSPSPPVVKDESTAEPDSMIDESPPVEEPVTVEEPQERTPSPKEVRQKPVKDDTVEQTPMRTTRSAKKEMEKPAEPVSDLSNEAEEAVPKPDTPKAIEKTATEETDTPVKDTAPEVTTPTRAHRKRGTSPVKGPPTKKQALDDKPAKEPEVVVTPIKVEKPIKSPTKKSPKGERLSKDEVAEISKLARDLGCLRRSSRTKAAAEETSPGLVVQSPVKQVMPCTESEVKKTLKEKAPVQESSEIKEAASKKPSKAAKVDTRKSETITRAAKKLTSVEPAAEKPEAKSPKAAKPKRQATLAESFSKEAPKKKSKEEAESFSKEAPKKKSKEEAPKVKSGSSSKKRKFVAECSTGKHSKKKSKEKKRKIKQETSIFDNHVAALKSKRVRPKRGERSVSETKPVKEKVAESKSEESQPLIEGNLKQAELDAVEELVKMSRGESPKPQPKLKKKKTKKAKSATLKKVDDIYKRHVATLRGKLKRRGKQNKAMKAAKKVKTNPVEEKKMTRIVGKKVYKEWLETQANATEKTAEVAQRKMPRQAFEEARAKTEQMAVEEKDASDDEEMLDDSSSSADDSFEHMPIMKKIGKARKRPDVKDEEMVTCNLECSKCKSPVTTRKDFNAHIHCHSTGPKMKGCPVCSQQFRNQNRCYGHLLREHAGWKLFHQCPYCLRKYSRKDAVQVHIGSVHPAEHRKEMAKKFGYVSKHEVEEEFKDEDIELDLTCKRCNRPIETKGDCYTHVMLHSQRGSRETRCKLCPMCDKTTKTTLEIWEHMVIEHAYIKPFTCDQCDTSFTSEESLKKHQQTLHKKFVEPIARVRSVFNSENWDIGMNQQTAEEPQGPLPLSSGPVMSLLELSLNTLVISQYSKIQNLNQLLTEHNPKFGTIMSSILSNGNKNDEKTAAAASMGNSESELEKGSEASNNVPITASKNMIPEDCEKMELPCVLCPTGVLGSDEFKLHVLKHICDSTRVCPVCRRTFSRKSSCRRHLIEHTYNWQHKCDLCSGTFPKEEYLEKHYHKHQEQEFQCFNCLLKLQSHQELWQHLNPDKTIGQKSGPHELVKFPCRRVHVCTKCHQEFRSAWGLQYHLENAHAENPNTAKRGFQCVMCNKNFKSQITLKNHQEIHEENSSYLCRHCNLVCRTKRQLTKHMEYKHMEKIYKCSYCAKMFATRSRLKEHAIMHQNKTFCCDMCGKVYRHQRVFETHCRQHFNPPVKKHRLYPCSECNHVSKSKEQLNLHMRRHTGERPFKCKLCSKAFSSQTGLWRHQMSHAGKKPHSCHLCGKSFVQKCSLDRHLLSHAGIKPYRCEYCSAEYSQSYPLTKHMERKHPNMPFILIKKEDKMPSTQAGSTTPETSAKTSPKPAATSKSASIPMSNANSSSSPTSSQTVTTKKTKSDPPDGHTSDPLEIDIFYMTDKENGAMNSQQPLTEIHQVKAIKDPPIVRTENNVLLAQL